MYNKIKMPLKDPEKRKEYMKEYHKKWYQKNKEKFAEHQKEYRKENKDKRKEYFKEYQQTPQGIKANTISNWKHRGVIHPDLYALYETYTNTNECDVCKKVFEDTFDRCLDHDHETGLFRQILCRGCNNLDSWKTSGGE